MCGTKNADAHANTESCRALDALRRRMISAGIPSEHAATACGLAAEYAMEAYKQGHSRGFNQGAEWINDVSVRRGHAAAIARQQQQRNPQCACHALNV